MTLIEHARRELTLIGEDTDTADGLVNVVEAFAAMGHSGGSAAVCIPMIEKLLRFQPLSPLTNDPAEWQKVGGFGGEPSWQNVRDSSAFSHDGGRTYWLLSEREAAPDDLCPLHTALNPADVTVFTAPDEVSDT